MDVGGLGADESEGFGRIKEMKGMNKICDTCLYNDCGFCDRKGIFVNKEDGCELWKDSQSWKEAFIRTFLAGH